MNGQSRETGNIGYTRQDGRQAKKKKKTHNTICVGQHHMQDIRRRQTKENDKILIIAICVLLNLTLVKFSSFYKSYSDVIYLIHFQLCRFVTDYLSTCYPLDMMW